MFAGASRDAEPPPDGAAESAPQAPSPVKSQYVFQSAPHSVFMNFPMRFFPIVGYHMRS